MPKGVCNKIRILHQNETIHNAETTANVSLFIFCVFIFQIHIYIFGLISMSNLFGITTTNAHVPHTWLGQKRAIR